MRIALTLTAAAVLALTAAPALAAADPPLPATTSPIRHVVVLDLENHSFDNLLGWWCDANPGRCPLGGMPATVTLSDGAVVKPHVMPDVVPQACHNVAAQAAAINGGKMDGWENIRKCAGGPGCSAANHYVCIGGYQPSQIPNITALAQNFAISDATFSLNDAPSWLGHLDIVAANPDGFLADNPWTIAGYPSAPGWGCDSSKFTNWVGVQGTLVVPACVPDYSLDPATYPNGGAVRRTPVPYEPTIMDRLGAAGLTWHIYGAASPGASQTPSNGYIWSVCPTFAECLDTGQHANLVDESQFFADASAGTLPSFSLITAGGSSIGATDSCHNGFSMTACDNYVGQVASAVENSPDWSSTALFITWDDCGCFYDQVPPPLAPDGRQEGPREPLIIVSPYAKPGYTDTTPTTFAGILSFTETQFGLSPLGVNDADSYGYGNAFSLTAKPRLGHKVAMVTRPVPKDDHIDWGQAQEDS